VNVLIKWGQGICHRDLSQRVGAGNYITACDLQIFVDQVEPAPSQNACVGSLLVFKIPETQVAAVPKRSHS